MVSYGFICFYGFIHMDFYVLFRWRFIWRAGSSRQKITSATLCSGGIVRFAKRRHQLSSWCFQHGRRDRRILWPPSWLLSDGHSFCLRPHHQVDFGSQKTSGMIFHFGGKGFSWILKDFWGFSEFLQGLCQWHNVTYKEKHPKNPQPTKFKLV